MSFLWVRTWQLGIKSLTLHPLRSLLTVLGIFIGVASVIRLLAIGEGNQPQGPEADRGLGANNIILHSVKPPSEVTGGARFFLRNHATTTSGSWPRFPISTRPSPFASCSASATAHGRRALVGCTPEYAEIAKRRWRAFHHRREYRDKQNHCVLAAGTGNLVPARRPHRRIHPVEEPYYVVVGDEAALASAGIGARWPPRFQQRRVRADQHFWSRVGGMIITRRSGSMERAKACSSSQITLRVNDEERDGDEPTGEADHGPLPSPRGLRRHGPPELLEQAKTTPHVHYLHGPDRGHFLGKESAS